MPIPDWTKTTEWDTVYLGGKAVVCRYAQVEITLPSGLDVKKGKGKKKATITDDGDPPAKVKLRFFMLPADVPAFQSQTIPLLRPGGKTAARPPLELGHPNAALWGINVITPGEISSPMPAPGGLLKIEVDATEWCPAPAAVKAKPKDEKPKDAEDWAAFKNTGENLKNRFFELVPALSPSKKPSSDAAKNL